MKALVARDKTAAGLILTDLPKPHLAENDVLVRVHAAGFTRSELEWPGTWTDRRGQARAQPVPGHEMSGVVAELGYGTTGVTVGQRVAGLTDWTRDGTLAEYVAVESRNLVVLPPDVDHVTAAALPISGLAAWQALFDHAHLRLGQTVLVHGAAGAVGSLAVQLAVDAGASVVGTGRADDRDAVLDRGAARFVELDDAGNGALSTLGEFDVALDVLGGEVLEATVPLIRPGGTLVSIAGVSRAPVRNGRMVFFVVEANRRSLSRLVGNVRAGRISPRVDGVCTLADAPAAFVSHGRTIVQLVGSG